MERPTRSAIAAALAAAGLPSGPLDVDRALVLWEECQDIIPRIAQRQETRARRISGRATGFAPDGIKRPADRDFLREADPPRPRRRK